MKKKIRSAVRKVMSAIPVIVNALAGSIFRSIVTLSVKGAKGFIFPDNRSTR